MDMRSSLGNGGHAKSARPKGAVMIKCECCADGSRRRKVVVRDDQSKKGVRIEDDCNEGTIVRHRARDKADIEAKAKVKAKAKTKSKIRRDGVSAVEQG
eukprot:7092930-Heterocapsa_arctica.AAC.1